MEFSYFKQAWRSGGANKPAVRTLNVCNHGTPDKWRRVLEDPLSPLHLAEELPAGYRVDPVARGLPPSYPSLPLLHPSLLPSLHSSNPFSRLPPFLPPSLLSSSSPLPHPSLQILQSLLSSSSLPPSFLLRHGFLFSILSSPVSFSTTSSILPLLSLLHSILNSILSFSFPFSLFFLYSSI